MSNYPPGVTDNDPYFTDESEREEDEYNESFKTCEQCGKLFRYPPSDNKDDATICAYCAPPDTSNKESQ